MFEMTVSPIAPTAQDVPLFNYVLKQWPPTVWEHYMIYATVRRGGLQYPVGALVHHRETQTNLIVLPFPKGKKIPSFEIRKGSIDEALDWLKHQLPRAWEQSKRRFDLSKALEHHTNSR